MRDYTKTLLKTIQIILTFLFISVLFPFFTFAYYEPTDAPGGTVTDSETLIAALGGDKAAFIRDNDVYLSTDINLKAPIILSSGAEITFFGEGCHIIRRFTDDSAFIINDGAILAIGDGTATGSDASSVFDGAGVQASAPLFSVNAGGRLIIHKGTLINNNINTDGAGGILNNGELYISGGEFSALTGTDGGAVSNNGTFAVTGGTFSDNTATNGGAIFSSGTCSASGFEIKNCNATNGGAFFVSSGSLLLPSGTVSDCGAILGGAVYVDSEARISLLGCRFQSCSANSGGCILNLGIADFNDSYITDCTATDGGGVFNRGTFTLMSGFITSCTADVQGGGLYNSPDGSYIQSGGSISVCTAEIGGGLSNDGKYSVSSGGINSCTAPYGKSAQSTTDIYFSKSAYFDKKGHIALTAVNGVQPKLIIETDLTPEMSALITAGEYTAAGGYKYVSPDTKSLLGGDSGLVETNAFRFSIYSTDDSEYHITDNGLVRRVTFINRLGVWFYIIIASAVAVCAICVFGSSIFRKLFIMKASNTKINGK